LLGGARERQHGIAVAVVAARERLLLLLERTGPGLRVNCSAPASRASAHAAATSASAASAAASAFARSTAVLAAPKRSRAAAAELTTRLSSSAASARCAARQLVGGRRELGIAAGPGLERLLLGFLDGRSVSCSSFRRAMRSASAAAAS
jgi:hypothetical protein